MEQIWYIPNLVALFGTVTVLIWQTNSSRNYERKQKEECEEENTALRNQLDAERAKSLAALLEKEKLELLLMGSGIRISGGTVTVQRDMVGNDKTEK